ncbi:helix-turn-helix transcriptional regulator [Arvimicrobium flavum]|uniref:helix-turn-helix transcriptional regulator n=1 Tax=Arvimicrobium flavum TaxID=3393320 RepID=UPI00237B5744|nr:AraC family transcriptional regulator [Mesorhizobium shangrilense]
MHTAIPAAYTDWASRQEIESTISRGGLRLRANQNFDGLNCHLESLTGTVGGVVLDGRYRYDQEHEFSGGSWFKIRIQLSGTTDFAFDRADRKQRISDARLFVISHRNNVTKTQRFSAGSRERIITLRFDCDDQGIPGPDVAAGLGERQALAKSLTDQETLCDLALPPMISRQAEILMRGMDALPAETSQSRMLTLSENCLDYVTRRLLGRKIGNQLTTQRASRIVALAMEIIEADLSTPPCLQTLCRRVGVNRNILNNAFRQVTGETAFTVLRSRRMELARELLVSSNQSISHIAQLVGYSQLANFSAAYRDSFGVAPSQEFERKNRC